MSDSKKRQTGSAFATMCGWFRAYLRGYEPDTSVPKQRHAQMLAAYRSATEELEPPTEAQIEQFIEYVAGAHSWYKHLPMLPPGKPFFFYLDPHSGMDVCNLTSGDGEFRERRDTDETKFHYTWMTTEEYRTRFGCLEYTADAGTTFVVDGRKSNHDHLSSSITDTRGEEVRIPPQVFEVGVVNVPGLIHIFATSLYYEDFWFKLFSEDASLDAHQRLLLDKAREFSTLRGEKGEQPRALNREEHRLWFQTRVEEMSEQHARMAMNLANPFLSQLLEPARKKVAAEMRDAIKRVVKLVFDS
jgi:hypothetical protein